MELVIKRFGELSAEELYEILSLRAETFIAQQKIVYNDLDGLDYRATHVFYLDTPQGEETQGEKTVAAYLRILDPGVVYPQPTIGRVCSRRKGCGIGGKLFRLVRKPYTAVRALRSLKQTDQLNTLALSTI